MRHNIGHSNGDVVRAMLLFSWVSHKVKGLMIVILFVQVPMIMSPVCNGVHGRLSGPRIISIMIMII